MGSGLGSRPAPGGGRPASRGGLVKGVGLALLLWVLGSGLALGQVTRTWTGAVSTDWFIANNWSPAGVPATNDTVNFAGGTIILSAPVTIAGHFNWSGGNLGGAGLSIASTGVMTLSGGGTPYLQGALTNAGTVNWTGGNLNFFACGYNPGPIVNLSGALWNLQCDGSLAVNCSLGTNTYFLNAGTVTKSAGTGTSYFSVPCYNTGTIGTLTGTLNFQNGGVVDGAYSAGSGTAIQFGNGSFTAGSAPAVSGAGAVQFTAGNLALTNNTVANLQLVGGTVTLGPSFQGGTITNLTLSGSTLAGTNTVTGLMVWGAGTLPGALTIANGAVLNLTGTGGMYLEGTLTNAGTVNWTGGNFNLFCCGFNAGPVVNLATGVWNIQCDASLGNNCGLGSNGSFLNAGMVTKTAGTGVTYIDWPLTNNGALSALAGTINFQNGGLIDSTYSAASGAAIQFANGNFVAGSAPAVSGGGAVQFSGGNLALANTAVANLQLIGGTVTLGPGFEGGTITNLTLSGSTLAGTNTVTGMMTWGAGTVPGALTVASGAVLNLTGIGGMYLEGTLTNAGTVNWMGGNFNLFCCGFNAGPVVNLATGVWNMQCDASLGNNCGLGTNGYFLNAGTVTKSAGTGTTYISWPFTNGGAVSALAGTINFQNGGAINGTYNAAAGAGISFGNGAFAAGAGVTMGGLGTIQFNGGSLVLGSDFPANFQLTGGTLNLGPGFQGGSITNLSLNGATLGGTNTVTGTFNWLAGFLGGALTVASNGVANLIGSSSMFLEGTLTNAGTVNWLGGTIYFYNCGYSAGPVVNLPGALWVIGCDQSMSSYCGASGSTYFLNLGTVQKATTSGTTYFSVPLANAGIVNVLKGVVNLNSGGTINGNFTAASGAAVTFGAGTFSYTAAPVLSGAGVFQFTGGTLNLVNDAIPNLQMTGGTVNLNAGFQGGSLTNFTLAGSTLNGSNLVTGTLNWNAGTLAGPLQIAPGGIVNWGGGTAGSALDVATNGMLNLTGNFGSMFLQAALTNAGTVNWTGGTLFVYNCGYNAGPIVNLPGALWNVHSDQSLSAYCGVNANNYFLNLGTVQKTAGTGTTYFSIPFDNLANVNVLQGTFDLNYSSVLGGTFTTASGTAVVFGSGTFSYGTPPLLAGAGSFQFTGGTLTLADNVIPNLQMTGGTLNLGTNFQGGTITNLTLTGSTLSGSNLVTGTFNWNSGTLAGGLWVAPGATVNWGSGTLAGPLGIATNGVLNLIGNVGSMFLDSGFTNAGVVNWSGGTVYLYNCGYNAGPMVNLPGALWNIQCDQSISSYCGLAGNNYFLNLGTVQKTAATGGTYFSVPFNNLASVNVLQGSIHLNSGAALGGWFTAVAGTLVTLDSGAFAYSTPPILGGAGAFRFNGGSLTLWDDVIPNLQYVGGTLSLGTNFQGGTITNLTLAGSTLSGSNNVSGTFNWNSGTLSGPLQAGTVNWGSGFANAPLVVATNGVFNLTGAQGAMYFENTFTNAGTVNWLGGSLQFYNCGYNSGPIVNLASGLWSIQCDQSIGTYCGLGTNGYFVNLGTIQKSGLTGNTYLNAPLYNSGILDIESGYMNFNGSPAYTQTGATLDFGISGSGGSARATISGSLSLDGTLGVALLNGYVPAVGDSIALMSDSSETGSFQHLALPTLPAGRAWQVNYGPSSLVLKVVANAAAASQLAGTVLDNHGHPVTNLTVFAYTTNATPVFVSTATDGNGSYSLSLADGAWMVGLRGLPALGYNPVPDQVVVASPFSTATNLLLNPGAEAGSLTNWVVGGSSNPRVDNGSFDSGYNPRTGSYDFVGGTGAAGSLSQTVALVATAGWTTAAIDSGGLQALASFWEQGLNQGSPSDDAYVTLTFLGATTNVLGSVSTGEVDFHSGAWGNFAGVYPVPVGTRYVQYVMNFVRHSGNDIDAFVDDNRLSVAATNTAQMVNFQVQPYSGPVYVITTTANPAGGGVLTGGGAFPPGTVVNVTAAASTNPLPYFFANWTENGVLESTNATYTFTASRDRALYGNFTLPVFTVTATNNPPGAGTVLGVGSYYYGAASVLTAQPVFGYSFNNWTEGTNLLGTNLTLSLTIYSNRTFGANYTAANLTHTVATTSSPVGIATVTGAGTYTNGQTANLVAPTALTNAPYVYTFQQFTLSNTVVGTNANFSKTFSTLDATNLLYVAVYSTRTILPLLTNVAANLANPVPATTNFQLSLQFDRSMATNLNPLVRLTNSGAVLQTLVPSNGTWGTTILANDTYRTPPITFVTGMDGTNQLWVSAAQDTQGLTLALTNPISFLVDATPPPAPVISVVSSNASGPSLTIGWTGYAAPSDLSGFRVYFQTTNFSSTATVPVYSALGAGASSYPFGGLTLDQTYYVAVQAYDLAGNSQTTVSPLSFRLPSTVPPPVTVLAAPVGATSAALSWSGYDTSALFGFAGFRVYAAQTNFSSVNGLTPLVTLGTGARTYQADMLDRTRTYYFAVVGFNGTNGLNPSVTTARWSDPYAGNIALNTTIGGSSPGSVNIYQSIVVVSNATLTIQPGTTLLFAPGTGLTVQQGTLSAVGTALAPIVFDSANDTVGNTPAAGDWNGITLGPGAGFSVLRFIEVWYGGGLTLKGCAPVVDALSANYNTPWGLGLQNGASLTTSNAMLTFDTVGVVQADTSVLTLQNSVLRNNSTNALAVGGTAMSATGNWWGTPLATNFVAKLGGSVNYTPFLGYEPLLTPAVGTSNGVTQIGTASVNLHLACRTADTMRLSEDINFGGVFFAPYAKWATFPLSAGGGLKRIYVQYKSVTGQTNTPLELDVNYVTGGPVIQSFSLSQGQTLTRPLLVTGTATAVLGVADVELYVDGVLLGTNAGGSLSQYFDVRTVGNAVHEVEFLARDTSGNLATLQNSVVVAATPPPAPVIVQPVAGLITNTNRMQISGTAEPFIGLQLLDNGSVLLTTNADANGSFGLPNAVLAEGDNLLLAIASDSLGTTPSAGRQVTVETIPPAQPVLNQPFYLPGNGLTMTWSVPIGGKPSATYRVFWAPSPFASTNQATGSSPSLNSAYFNTIMLTNGTYYFGVVGYDTAGNPSPLSALVSAVYDATPPVMTVAYTPAPPIGVRSVTIVLSANKPLASTPSLTLQPYGSYSPVLMNLTNVALNTWQTAFTVTAATPTGPVAVSVTAKDLAANVFSGVPNGPALAFDTTPPVGSITTTPLPPIQTTNNTNVTVMLALSKAAASGIPPVLNFTPPQGAVVGITLGGSGSNWSGTLPLTSAMGSGFGQFALTAQDAVGNIGTNLVAGRQLELYNTALPTSPPAPTGLSAVSLPAGAIHLSWNVSSNAQMYRLYREPGTNPVPPAVLVADNISSNSFSDLPPVDGYYRYGVTASRLGSESGLSNVVIALADRVAPPAPTNVMAALAPSGVQITWQEPAGGAVDHYRIYRNGTLVASVAAIAPVIDYPAKGTNVYVVAAADAVGNENPSAPAMLTLLVGPVNNLAAVVSAGQPIVLNWVSTDAQATGFNIYRNGIKQNPSLLTNSTYADPLSLSDATQYAVTAANGSGQESPARLVTVFPVSLSLLVNAAGSGTNNPVLADYFDQYQAGITNLSSTNGLPLAQMQITRSVSGMADVLSSTALTTNVAAGGAAQCLFILAEPSLLATQTVTLVVAQQTDSEGSQVNYQQTFTFLPAPLTQTEVVVSANQVPLAGGLTTFQIQVRNPSSMDVQFIVSRGFGAQPGDFYVSVQNSLGQEVSRTAYQGTPPGTVFLGDGRAYATVKAGGVLNFSVPNVLAPAALSGATNVIFQGVASVIYSHFNTAAQVVSGPLTGSMISSGLAQAPYYGSAHTDQASYANNPTIVIAGQALNTATGLPVPGAALNIGFSARGHKWYLPVMADTNGNYQLSYAPPSGFSGLLTIWAANPLVVDKLNQAAVTVYEIYSSPSSATITMSKNDTLNFSIQLINPGDLPMTAFSYGFRAYQMAGTNQVPVTSVTGTNQIPGDFVLSPNQRQSVNLQLSAAIDAPNSVVVEYTFTSAEGAVLKFTGNTTLLPAVPVLAVVSPAAGYLEVSVNRGDQISGQFTLKNTGFKALQGITLTPPTNTPWMQVNLPVSPDGLIHLPDLGVGQSNTVIVVFSPPSQTPLAFYQDTITVQGTNSASAFTIHLAALVTSHLTGGVQFYVDDALGLPVPNASILLHSDVLFNQPPACYTDTNGLITVTNLQEGSWNWQVSGVGCRNAIGTVAIASDQVAYQHARLSRSLVTVTFSVVPVPFTDVYTIQVEQTYETHVPAPVLVLDPPYMSFRHVASGFEANYTVNLKNYGLIQLSNVRLTGHQNGGLQLTPLITYIPEILPMQSVDVPFTLTYSKPAAGGAGQAGHSPLKALGGHFNLSAAMAGGSSSGGSTSTAASAQGSFFCEEDGAEEQDGGDETATVEDDSNGGDGGDGDSMDDADSNAGDDADINNDTTSNDDPLPDEPDTSDMSDAGDSCFAPNTPVLMADYSLKAIADVRLHDRVRSGTHPWNVAIVNRVLETTSEQERVIRFVGANTAVPRELTATPEHLIWVDGKGWVSALNLAAGDWLLGPAGERLRVTENQPATARIKTYTLSLAGDSAFYANGVLVRHLCGKTPIPPTPRKAAMAK